MKNSRIFGTCVSVGMMMALSGCLSGGSGGSASGSGDFETAFDAASQRAPTSDMPTALEGNYKGQMKVGVNSGSSNLVGTGMDIQNAEIIGDVDLNVAWTEGMAGNPFTGTASGFVATEAGTANSVAIDGTLNVDTALPGSISRVHTPSQVIAGQTIPAIDTGAFELTMAGQLGSGDTQGDVTLLLGGSFFGPGANAMVGAVSGGVKDVGSTNPQIFDAGIGGTFYATKP